MIGAFIMLLAKASIALGKIFFKATGEALLLFLHPISTTAEVWP